MIESIDHAAKTFVIKPTKERQSRQFVWKEYTSFRKDGAKAAPGDLRAGVRVKIYYRKEFGAFVPRSVCWKSAPATVRSADASRGERCRHG